MRRDTLCLYGGYVPGNGEPRMMPIVQSTTFKYATSEEMGDLFDLKKSGYFYSRLANPTCDLVAQKICQLEGGYAGMLTSSGQMASFMSLTNLAIGGDHFILSAKCYGGTSNLLTVTMPKMGYEVTLVDPDTSKEELGKAFKENTRAVFAETISNPAGVVLDIEKFAEVAHKHGVPLVVDNTFATPVKCRPIEWGADIVVHSTTKYIDGHGMTVGGAIIDSGNFDWDKHADKFPGLTTPDESYHGLVYTKAFGKGAYITKAVAQMMRDLGACQSPHNAFLLNVSLESLHLRMDRHCSNAMKAAEFLAKHPKVEWITYAGLPNDKYHALAEKYLPDGVCGVLCFGPKGGREGAMRFVNSLKLIAIETHVADARSCVLHPASHTHRQLTDEQLIGAGVSPDLIRLSLGIEHPDDLIEDLAQALENV